MDTTAKKYPRNKKDALTKINRLLKLAQFYKQTLMWAKLFPWRTVLAQLKYQYELYFQTKNNNDIEGFFSM